MSHPRKCLILTFLVACAALRASAEPAALQLTADDDHTVAVPSPTISATVLVFVTPECPLANRYAPALNELAKQFAGRVAFYRVYASPGVTQSAAKAHETAYHYGFPSLLDPDQKAVAACGATRTPEVAILDATGALRYRGSVDDRYVDFNHYRPVATKHYVRDALDAVLANKPVPIERTDALGCYIPEPEPTTKLEPNAAVQAKK